MRIVISNQDRMIGGTDTDFKVQLNLPVDISRKYYNVYIEKVLCSISQTSCDSSTDYYIASKQNSIPDF